MFNTENNYNETKVCPVTQIVEKTITPDKVTEMYDKVKEEVENSLIRTYLVKNNLIDGIGAIFHNNASTMTKYYIIRYILNGKEFITKGFTPNETDYSHTIYKKMIEHFTNEVSIIFLKESSELLFKNSKK